MDLPSAIEEFAEMLALASSALERFVERHKPEDMPSAVGALLSEAKGIAGRLTAIADELRRQALH